MFIDSETDFSSDSNYDEYASEILFVGDILQPFQFETIFTAAEIQGRKELFYLTTHSTHFIYGYMASDIW